MEAPLHIKFLKELSTNGIGRTYNLIPFLMENFPIEGGGKTWRWQVEGKPATYFMRDLTRRNLIDFDTPSKDDFPEGIDFIDFEPYQLEWFQERALLCFITSKGMDYIENYESTKVASELNSSFLTINKETIENYSFQKWLLGLTFLASVFSAGISVMDYLKPEPDLKPITTNVKLISVELRMLKEQLKQSPSHGIMPSDSSHKRQPSVSNN